MYDIYVLYNNVSHIELRQLFMASDILSDSIGNKYMHDESL